jgi:hypothetical protein
MFKITTPTLSQYEPPSDADVYDSMRHYPDAMDEDGKADENGEDQLGEGSNNFTSPGTVITSSSAYMRSVGVESAACSSWGCRAHFG